MVLLPCGNCCECLACQYMKHDCLEVSFSGFLHSDKSCHECNFLDDSTYIRKRNANIPPTVLASVHATTGKGASLGVTLQKFPDSHFEVSELKLINGGSGYSGDAVVKFSDFFGGSLGCGEPKASLTVERVQPTITATVSSTNGAGAVLGVSLSGPTGETGQELWGVASVSVLKGGKGYGDEDSLSFTVAADGVEQEPAVGKITVGRSQPEISAKIADGSIDWVSLSVSTEEFQDIDKKKYWSIKSLAATFSGPGLFDYELVELTPAAGVVTLEEAEVHLAVTSAVSAISVTAGGEYSVPPSVLLTGGGSRAGGAQAHAKIDGSVTAIALTGGGLDYTSAPSVTFTGGGGTGASATAYIDESGEVIEIFLESPGSGYQSPPTVEITGGGGHSATALAYISGPVSEVVLDAPGSGYLFAPGVTFYAGEGTGAAATASISGQYLEAKISPAGKYYTSGAITTVAVTDAGEYYLPGAVTSVTLEDPGTIWPPFACEYAASGCPSCPIETNTDFYNTRLVVEFDAIGEVYRLQMYWYVYTVVNNIEYPGSRQYIFIATKPASGQTANEVIFEPEDFANPVESVVITSGGSSYQTPPKIEFTGGVGKGAKATAILDGTVSSIEITSPGSGYDPEQPPSVTLSGGGGEGALAVATVTEAGAISKIEVSVGGSGYASSPDVEFYSEKGTGLAAKAYISAEVASVEISSGGFYQTPPTVEFTEGGGSGASAYAVLGTNYYGIQNIGCHTTGKATVSSGNCNTTTTVDNCSNLPAELTANLSGFGPIIQRGAYFWNFCPWQNQPLSVTDFECDGPNPDALPYCEEYQWCGECDEETDGYRYFGGTYSAFAMGSKKDVTLVLERADVDNCNVVNYIGKYYMPAHEGPWSLPDCDAVECVVTATFAASPTGVTIGFSPPSGAGETATGIVTGYDNGGISNISLTYGGSGYAREVLAVVRPEDVVASVNTSTGTGATFNVVLISTGRGDQKRWRVSQVTVASGGSGYSPEDYLTFTPDNGETDEPPSNFWTVILDRLEPTVVAEMNSDFGSGAQLTAVISQTVGWDMQTVWAVESVDVGTAGSGYSDGEQVSFSCPDGVTQFGASAHVRVDRYEPTVLASIDSQVFAGTGAELSASLQHVNDHWEVDAIGITDGGAGYSIGAAVYFNVFGVVDSMPVAEVTSVGDLGEIQAITIYNAGNLYATNGEIQEVVVVDIGEYYATNGTIVGVVQDPDGGGSFYRLLPTGAVEQDYPVVEISSATGMGAVAIPVVNTELDSPYFGSIESVSMASQGSGYLAPGQVGWMATLSHVAGVGGKFENFTIPSALGRLAYTPLWGGASPDTSRMAACAEELISREYPMFYRHDFDSGFFDGSYTPFPSKAHDLFAGADSPTVLAEMANPSQRWAALGVELSLNYPMNWRVSAITSKLNADGLFGPSPVSFTTGHQTVQNTSASAEISVTAVVAGAEITSPGSGYSSPPGVIISGGLAEKGIPAEAHATISASVVEVDVTNGGTGYSSPPDVSFSGGGGASAYATIDGSVVSLSLMSPGSGYIEGEPITVEFSGGGGGGATAKAEVDAFGKVSVLTLESGGNNYQSAPTVTISGGSGSGAWAVADVAGPVDEVHLIDGGDGYGSSPTVLFSGGGGVGAAAIAKIEGSVSSIVVDKCGFGYIDIPEINIAPPSEGGSSAEADAVIEGQNVSVWLQNGGSYTVVRVPPVINLYPPRRVGIAVTEFDGPITITLSET